MRHFFKKYLEFRFVPVLGIQLFLGFVVFTIIGTLSHEMGHIAMAKLQGFETSLHYGYMQYDIGSFPSDIEGVALEYKDEISKGLDFPKKNRWEEVRKERQMQRFWVSLGGPLQTVLFGTIGCILLFIKRKRLQEKGLKLLDWIFVFLALFWLREWFNPVYGLASGIIDGDYTPFNGRSDELRLARTLGWWEGSISLPLALIAFVIALWVIFKMIPKVARFTFIISGLFGGVFGFFFWLEGIGPILLP